MRFFSFAIALTACGSAPLHVAVDLVTPIPASAIASVDFEVISPQGKTLLTKTSTSNKGVLQSVNFAPPKGVPIATLRATLRDANREMIGVGRTQLDFTAHGKGTATVFASSPSAIAFTAHPRPSPRHRFHSSVATTGDGKVWIVGGEDENGALITAIESYDPYTLTFATGIDLDYACLDPTLAVTTSSSDEILVVAGGTDLEGQACPAIQLYDTDTNSKGPFIPSAARANTFALLFPANATFALIGGTGAPDTAASAAEFYVTKELLLQTTASFLTEEPRRYGAGLVVGNTAYVTGDSLRVASFDQTSGAQTEVGQFTVARTSPATVVAGANAFYVLAGGASAIERWQVGGPIDQPALLPDNRVAPQAVEVDGPQLVVSGGRDPVTQQPLDDAAFYLLSDPSKVTATLGIRHLAPRADHRMIRTVTNTLLVIGGSATGPTSELYSLP
jgi:hypothetical protein